MANFDGSYLPPGVYTQTQYNANTPVVQNTQRIPCIIGEGQQTFTQTVELHRGSSATSDDQVVGEDLSDQVTGSATTFQVTYHPIVLGDGTGTTTNDPTKITVTVNGSPVSANSLNGAAGTFSLLVAPPVGSVLVVSYFFKKTDTLITKESLTGQVPAYASLTLGQLVITPQYPGFLPNNTTVALTLTPASGQPDSTAVSGVGSDAISVEIWDSTTASARTYDAIAALINAGTPTLSAGYLSATVLTTGVTAVAAAATALSGGMGPSSNTTFQVANLPIVDGTNGGTVTNDVTKVTLYVNNTPVTVAAVDGANGLVTAASPVASGSNLSVTYWTNSYQYTSDALPQTGVTAITRVGFSQTSTDFTNGTDYTLSNNAVAWGAAVAVTDGQETPGYTPFDSTVITPTMVDEKVWLQLAQGVSNGKNATFTLTDSPVDGSGLGRVTNNASLVTAYVGATPYAALLAGPVKVAKIEGATATVVLFNAPSVGNNVYVTYYRSLLNDHTFTMTVQTPGVPGTGTYLVTDENNQSVLHISKGTAHVTDANFTNTGIVWPNNKSDLMAAIGGADETVTITFQNDGLNYIKTPAVQASYIYAGKLVFRNTTPGVAGNSVNITFVNGVAYPDANALNVDLGDNIVVELLKADGITVRTYQDVLNLVTNYPVSTTDGGALLCSAVSGADLTPQATALVATNFIGGAAAVTTAYAERFLVTTSRTAAQATADGLGLTGGATTPVGTNTTLGATGYLGQTYIDPVTAFTFTVVSPEQALNYGYTQLPSPQYRFAPGDTLTFVASRETGHITGSKPTPTIPGLSTKVTTTYGMNPGDTATLTTFHNDANEPAVGEYYYVTYTYEKSAASLMTVQLFNSDTDCYNAIGQPSLSNRLALAVQQMYANSGQLTFAIIQVPTTGTSATASDQTYMDAIQLLAQPLPGGVGRKVNGIVTLSTSPTVHQFLSSFLNKQSTPRNKGEATAWVGYNQYLTPAQISANAAAIGNQRVLAVYPNNMGISLTVSGSTGSQEFALDGTFLAAAALGLQFAGSNDVATSLTNQNVVGFTRGLVVADSNTMNLMAVNGVTVFTDNNGSMKCRDFKTTDPSNVLTSKPYVTTTADFINQSLRSSLRQFIGRKATGDLANAMQVVVNSQLFAWNGQIISGYGTVQVNEDSNDPTIYNIVVPVRPMFSVDYINVTLQVDISL